MSYFLLDEIFLSATYENLSTQKIAGTRYGNLVMIPKYLLSIDTILSMI